MHRLGTQINICCAGSHFIKFGFERKRQEKKETKESES
jgi:hypothetical protein